LSNPAPPNLSPPPPGPPTLAAPASLGGAVRRRLDGAMRGAGEEGPTRPRGPTLPTLSRCPAVTQGPDVVPVKNSSRQTWGKSEPRRNPSMRGATAPPFTKLAEDPRHRRAPLPEETVATPVRRPAGRLCLFARLRRSRPKIRRQGRKCIANKSGIGLPG